MKIYKHCKKEHNIALGAQAIQLGTFVYFAESDPSFPWTDPTEGGRDMQGEQGTYKVSDIAPMTPNSIKLKGEGTLTGKINIQKREKNGYALCCSRGSSNNGIFPSYDICFWVFNAETQEQVDIVKAPKLLRLPSILEARENKLRGCCEKVG